jgi:hypothetical protein
VGCFVCARTAYKKTARHCKSVVATRSLVLALCNVIAGRENNKSKPPARGGKGKKNGGTKTQRGRKRGVLCTVGVSNKTLALAGVCAGVRLGRLKKIVVRGRRRPRSKMRVMLETLEKMSRNGGGP